MPPANTATKTTPLPANLPARRQVDRLPSTVTALAAIPEEEIWLQSQKSARTRRAYRLDVAHFLRTLSIATPASCARSTTRR